MVLNFTKRQWLTLIIVGLADFFNAVCVSLQSPFFPQEAEKKGSTATEYGLVFGIFELVVFLVSPIYGHYMKRIGVKTMFNAGIFTTGTAAIVFGLLDKIPGHTLFITAAFVVRIIEALGNAAFLTASFSIIASEFPNNVGSTFASLETCFGLGLIVGPMVGGSLYAIGGYSLPFVVLGSALFTVAFLTLIILPKIPTPTEDADKKHGILKVLRVPGILVVSIGIGATSASIGFISATLEPHVREFDLGPVLLGVVFIINGAVYAGSAPFWGYLVDKNVNPKVIAFIGSLFIIAGFVVVGPASFLPYETSINFVITGLVLHGLGIGAILVSSFTDALETAIRNGFMNNISTYGVISGLWTSTFAFGAFWGPTVSGFLYDKIGFRSSTNFIIGLHTIVAIIFLAFMLFHKEKIPNIYKEVPATEDLIIVRRESIPKLNSTLATSRESLYSNTERIPMPITRGCAMNNLIMCSSEGSYTKSGHWTRLEEASQALIAEAEAESYGSFNIRGYREEIEAIP